MPQIISDERDVESQRQHLRDNLTDITSRANAALTEAGIQFPVMLLVPSRSALITLGTPDDPDDAEWDRASEIVAAIVRDELGIEATQQRAIPCAMFQRAEANHAAE